MRTKFTSLIVMAICGLLLAGCCTAHQKQWEYKVERILQPSPGTEEFDKVQQTQLNEMGKDGWVLVTKDANAFYFERVKRSPTVTVQ
jgi:hypothetical protein